jgi:hypothetical protein
VTGDLPGSDRPGSDRPGSDRPGSDAPGGRPDFHDPSAGFGGAPPAQSALTLRLVLATFGLVVCAGGAVGAALAGATVFCVILAIAAAIAAVDLAVVIRRKAGGEPG